MNSRFASFQKQQQQNGPPSNLNELLRSMMGQIAPTGMNPEQIVRQLVQSGKMSQAQFDKYASVANAWTGKR